MKWGALAVALAVLAGTAAALVLTLRSGPTTPTKLNPAPAAKVVTSPVASVLDPIKQLGTKPSCRSSEDSDNSGDDRSSNRCDDQAGDSNNAGESGGENEPDEKDSGD